MRVNEPVTNREVFLPEGETIVSRTDPGGRITFVNKAFIDISGFTAAELIGAPHNIVRHPDMPREAFADLWDTIKAGRPWEGLVKNRTKSGDFYWVQANVTPVTEGGRITGYISIRLPPPRARVAMAEAAYARIRNGDARGLALLDGELVAATPASRLRNLWACVTVRLAALCLAMLGGLLIVGGLGVQAMWRVEAALAAGDAAAAQQALVAWRWLLAASAAAGLALTALLAWRAWMRCAARCAAWKNISTPSCATICATRSSCRRRASSGT